jgi:uncharacterized protein
MQAAPSSTHTLVAALAGALRADLIETHISWVLLAGDHAYKIKKPVRLPFVDYSTLRARRHFCEEELRLNRRLAPSLYLGLTRITGSHGEPQLEGPGPVLEYAVRMCRFRAGALFSERLEAGMLTADNVDDLAKLLAEFHSGSADFNPPDEIATAEHRRDAALAALDGTTPPASQAEQAQLRDWLVTGAAALAPLWTARRNGGHVRECHGDLHLDNVVCLDGQVAAFDCIEFDPALRCIDVIDDAAFTVMDFSARGRNDFAFRFLDGWLSRTGEHAALPALRFSVVYRALVRAQVASLRGAGHEAAARRYLENALAWARPAQARLLITHGLPGSGKTFQSQRLLERERAVRIRSDVERKRLFGLGILDSSRAAGADIYSKEATTRTYDQMFAAARLALGAGYPVILDAAFLRREERAKARTLADELGVPFTIVNCVAPLSVMRERLLARQGDASEADLAVLDRLRAAAEPLEQGELKLLHAADAE